MDELDVGDAPTGSCCQFGERDCRACISLTVDRFRQNVLNDELLSASLGSADVSRLTTCVAGLIAEAVSGAPCHAEDLRAAARHTEMSAAEYDRFGHHLLWSILVQRMGADILLRVGAALVAARHLSNLEAKLAAGTNRRPFRVAPVTRRPVGPRSGRRP